MGFFEWVVLVLLAPGLLICGVIVGYVAGMLLVAAILLAVIAALLPVVWLIAAWEWIEKKWRASKWAKAGG